MVNCASASGYAFAFSPLLLLDIFPVGPFKRLRADEKRQRSRSGKERGRGRDFERRDDDDFPEKERERERIGIRPPKMRNEKKKKNNEGQPRARFLPFSLKKNASRLARRKKDLPSSALVVVVVVSSKRFVCFVEILSLSLSLSLYNNCLFLVSFLPPSFFPLGGKHTFSKP